MKAYHRLGSVFGIEIGLHVSWYFIFVLLAYSLGAQYFPGILPGASRLEYALMGIVASFLLFLSVLMHEISHSLVARSFRLKIDRIYLFFFGGISQIGEDGISPKSEILMALAGPAFSLVLGACCLSLSSFAGHAAIGVVLSYLGSINITLGIFNLLPGFPLDGGRVLRGLVWWKTGSFEVATVYASKSGKFFGLMMVFFGMASVFFGGLGGLWIALIGGFLFMMAESSFEQMLLKRSLSARPVSVIIERRPVHVSPAMPVDRLVKEYFLRRPIENVLVLDKGGFAGVVALDRVVRVRPQLRRSILVKDVMVPAGRVPSLSSEDSLFEALRRMSESRIELLPVIDRGRFTGVITREALVHFLRVSPLSGGGEVDLEGSSRPNRKTRLGKKCCCCGYSHCF